MNEHDRNIDEFWQLAADTANRAALQYLRAHGQQTAAPRLAKCLRSWCKMKLSEALHDAREAVEAGMGQVAEATLVCLIYPSIHRAFPAVVVGWAGRLRRKGRTS